jgi:Fe-S cluster biogenesis protein NfuA
MGTIESVERALDTDVRPGLSAHAGSILVTSADDQRVELEFVGSCLSCYFRISCAVNLVAPVVHEAVGHRVDLHITGVSHAQLSRLSA